MTKIAALFVETDGYYFGLPDVDPWDITRDARTYEGDDPVVAHPPCFLWVNMAAVNWKRYRRQLPAWYPGGDDEGCFASALASVRRCGGVLEHPASSFAWKQFELPRPQRGMWIGGPREWVTEVWQAAYGHKCRKRTWLFYCGKWPPSLDWTPKQGTHQVGWFDRNKPTVSKKDANRTPPAFRDALLALARGAR